MDLRHYPEVRALREAVLRPSTQAREALAAACLPIVHSCLQSNWPRWSLWFNGDLTEAVEGAASQVVASLLREDPAGSGIMPVFRKRFQEALTALLPEESAPSPGSPSDLEGWLRRAEDGILALALRRLLRLLGEQAMNEEWRLRHPEEAKLRRRVREWADAKGLVPPNGDGRGTIVAGLLADFRLHPLSLEGLFERIGSGWSEERQALEKLEASLVPDSVHGGYCFLNDIVRVMHEVTTGRIARDGLGGAVPAALGIRVTGSGLPESVFIERVRKTVSAMTRACLDHDAGRGRITDRATIRALSEAVTEIVCRDFGMGLPAWDGRSQEQLALALVPGLTAESYARDCRGRIDYAIRRVRGRLGKGEWLPLSDSLEGTR